MITTASNTNDAAPVIGKRKRPQTLSPNQRARPPFHNDQDKSQKYHNGQDDGDQDESYKDHSDKGEGDQDEDNQDENNNAGNGGSGNKHLPFFCYIITIGPTMLIIR